MNRVIYVYPGVPALIVSAIALFYGIQHISSGSGNGRWLIGGAVLMVGLVIWRKSYRVPFLAERGDKLMVNDGTGIYPVTMENINFINIRGLRGKIEIRLTSGKVITTPLPVLLSASSIHRIFPEFEPANADCRNRNP